MTTSSPPPSRPPRRTNRLISLLMALALLALLWSLRNCRERGIDDPVITPPAGESMPSNM